MFVLCSFRFNQKERPVMSQSLAEPAPNPLAPATLDVLLRGTLDSLPCHKRATAAEQTTRREAACLAIAALGPRDPIEAMLAAGVVAAHYHMMDSMRCAVQPELPATLQLRFLGRAIALSNLASATQRDLEGRQTRAALQPVGIPVPVPGPRPEAAPVAALPEQAAPTRVALTPGAGPASRASATSHGATATRPVASSPSAQPGRLVATGPAAPASALDPATEAALLADLARRASTSAAALAA